MFGGEVIRTAIQFANFCNREVDGCFQEGRIDSLGFEYLGLTTKYVPASLISVPLIEFSKIDDIQQLHEVITTDNPCKLLVRKRACFCRHCLDFNFEECDNEDASPVEERTIRQVGNAVVVQARGRTKTRASQDEHRRALGLLAAPDSVVGVTFATEAELCFIRITDAMHKVIGSLTCPITKSNFPEGDDVLKGKWLVRDGQTNILKVSGAKDVIIHACSIRTAPLPFEILEDSNLEIQEDVGLLAQEYLT
jgi:hypothetical protein